MSIQVIVDASVDIDPIPTDAKRIVRRATITVKGTAERVKESTDLNHSGNEKSESDMNFKLERANVRKNLRLRSCAHLNLSLLIL